MDTAQPNMGSSVIDDDGDSSMTPAGALSDTAASVSAATATPLESSVPSNDREISGLSDTDSSEQDQSLSKPTRRELLEALQAHLEVLDRRGQVSTVVPAFLRRANTTAASTTGKKHKANTETADSSACGQLPQTKISRHSTDKDKYYEDLAKEMERIPEIVNFASKNLARKRSATQNHESDESEISTMIASFRGTESPNNDSETSDFTSSQPSKRSHLDSPT